jgi:hypothetical protein
VNEATVLRFAAEALAALPGLIQAGMDAYTFAKESSDKVAAMVAEQRDPTPEEWDQLNAVTASLRAELHAPEGGAPSN